MTFDPKSQPSQPPPFLKNEELFTATSLSDALDSSLPAQLRFRRRERIDYFRPRDNIPRYLKTEFCVRDIDVVSSKLWVAGLRNNIRPLHRQRSLGRQIVVTEDVTLHMLWRGGHIFLKPLPHLLLNYDFFTTHLCADDSAAGQYNYGAAVALLGSYTKLVLYESDLRLAKTHGLVPEDVTSKTWSTFSNSVTKTLASGIAFPPRYQFGELNLSRVNSIYRFSPSQFPNGFFRGRFGDNERYATFFESNFKWFAVVFAYFSILLSALQVGLGTDQGQRASEFDHAAWVLCIFSMGLVAIGITIGFAILIMAFCYHAIFAASMESRAKEAFERHPMP